MHAFMEKITPYLYMVIIFSSACLFVLTYTDNGH